MAQWAPLPVPGPTVSDAFTIELDLPGWDAFLDDLADAPESLAEHMHNAMDASLDLLIDWTSAETPVNLGLLRSSWTKEVTGERVTLIGEMFTPLTYGWPVERGRRPGQMPPVDAIKLWARRKLGLSGDELEQAAYLIARAIGRRGTDGAAMVYQAFNRAVSGNEIDRLWEYELERFLQELAS